jgi:hypothetical protein
LYAALDKGVIDTAGLTKVLVEYGNQDDLYEAVYSIDATTWARPDAYTVDGRVMAYAAKGTKAGSHATPSWSYQVVARQTHQTGSWSLPVCVDRVGAKDNHSKFTVAQIKAVAESHRGANPLFVLDSGYSGHYLTYLLRRDQVDASVLVRLSSDRVMREQAVVPAKRGVGQPAKHGVKFSFSKPARLPDDSSNFSCWRYGEVQVDAYHNLHPALNRNHTGAKEMDKLPIISGTVLHVSCTKRTGNDGWWLWYDGDSTDLEQLFWCYAHRFDIEHTFRYSKQSLGLTGTEPGSARVADVWVTVVMSAYALLALSRRAVTTAHLPWEKVASVISASTARVRRAINQHLGEVLSHLGVEVFKVRPPGRAKGATWGPRTRHSALIRHPELA